MIREDWEFLVKVFKKLSIRDEDGNWVCPYEDIEAAKSILNAMEPIESAEVGLDIDGTIDECPKFFAKLSEAFGEKLHILTGRAAENVESTAGDLEKFGVRYNTINHAEGWDGKAEACNKRKIEVLIEDQDEYIEHIPENVLVLKVRNGGNYDFKKKKWLV